MKCFRKNKDINNSCLICGNNYFKKIAIIDNIIYINCYEPKIEIKNRTELIENMINNIIKQSNISNIDNGIDNIFYENSTSIIITSTKNQKNNENKKIITIDLDK